MQPSKTRYIIGGLVAIILVYALYYKAFIYVGYYAAIPRVLRYAGRFLVILLVFGIGRYVFKKIDVKWIGAVWNFIYFGVTVLLILIALYDWILGPAPTQVRLLAGSFHEFLISPILYAGLLIVNRTLARLNSGAASAN